MLAMLFFAGVTAQAQTNNAAKPAKPGGGMPPNIKQYYVLFYYKGPQRITDTAVLNPLQRQHLAHIDKHYELGKVGIAGPFGGKDDLRGLLILQDIDEAGAKAIGDTDPLVKVGHLRYEVRPWYSEPGHPLK